MNTSTNTMNLFALGLGMVGRMHDTSALTAAAWALGALVLVVVLIDVALTEPHDDSDWP